MSDLTDRTFVVTGATAGIGAATSRGLADRGACIFAVARSEQKLKRLLMALNHDFDAEHCAFVADLSVVSECRRVAVAIRDTGAVDVLVNNVGAVFPKRTMSPEGIEMTLALNHLGPFVLTTSLLETLKTATSPRVVNVASQAHADHLDFANLQGEHHYGGLDAYQRSKLLNILFTAELHRREGDWLTTGSLHPGVVQTALLGDYDAAQAAESEKARKQRGAGRRLLGKVAGRLRGTPQPSTGMSADEGARTSLFVATSPKVLETPGRYWRELQVAAPSSVAQDAKEARRAWKLTEGLLAEMRL
ncbi:MAG: NAD(P)-dependent dehydrogenase (short-subunit alcohol dehydrogenase family) [Bradymonadia bacterium]|jgi:NAD(P)-dependent dehydrogenase (short-subunit alcohol dehydrogenase family)